jgi:hypothetical protein
MSNRATTAAKGRPKKSYARGKSRKEEDPEAMIPWMPDETFCEEMSEWVDSPEGQLWLDMSDTLEVPLKHVGLDVRQRKFLWPDAKRLDLDQSVRRINQQYPDFPEDKIEEFLIYWIQELYVPEGYSESQMDELERLTEQWAKDHERQSTRRRTRHS